MKTLRQIREEAGLTLKALGRELGVDPGFLSRIERGVVRAPKKIDEAYHQRFASDANDCPEIKETTGVSEPSAEYRTKQLNLALPVTRSSKLQTALSARPLIRTETENIPPELYLSPNPHLGDLVNQSSEVKPVSMPYSANICAGKNTYVYDAHTYHTKVPPQGIGLLIDYYTRPGDVVLDPFCGSGMTGVAATERGRKAILCDLSPAAAFIAYNMTTPIPALSYLEAVRSILLSARSLEERLYKTKCRTCEKVTPILYMVWSYGMLCKYCGQEFIVWDVARDEHVSVRESRIKTDFDCPSCQRRLKKRQLRKTIRYPVQVGYRCCQNGLQETTTIPSEQDLAIIKEMEREGIPEELWHPTDPFHNGVNTSQPIAAGITSVDKAYTTRALWAMAHLWNVASRWPDPVVKPKLLFTLTSLYKRVSVFSEFRFWGGSGNTANFNVPAIMNEQNVFKVFERKANTISWYLGNAPRVPRRVRVSTQSACHLAQIPDSSVDYVFTDPPFGSNINYSEMNFLWESWLGVHTDITEEAIINKVQGKGLVEYQHLLAKAFSEIGRVLKNGGWMTVVFHNSSSRVWDALQKAIAQAGFAIEGTQTFDKKHGTFKQFVSDNAVGYDLALHCRQSSSRQSLKKNSKQAVRQQAAVFIRQAVTQSPNEYVVRYLHVARGDEFDYRRLYAEWLADALPKTSISISFEEFRALVDQTLD